MGMACHDKGVKVVVVEDNPIFISFWGRILKDLGVEDHRLFSNPVEAEMYLKSASCEVLISGIIMSGQSGYELAKMVCHKNPGSRIVLTTAYGTDLSRFDLRNCRFHLLHKPFTDIAALKRFLKHIIEGDECFDDVSSEESSSENEDYPLVTEWKL